MNGFGFFKAVVLLATFLVIGGGIIAVAIENENVWIVAVPFGIIWVVLSMIFAWKGATIDE